jgi:Poly(hydroxyalcanoate) granule associated protein (phasin)
MSQKPERSHDVWLAGLGALAVAEQEGSDLFQTLVKKGEEIEQRLVSDSGRSRATRRPPRDSEKFYAGAAAEVWKSVARFVVKHKEPSEPPGSAEVSRLQAHRLELAKQEFLKEFGEPVGELLGDPERWRREGKIFTLTDRNATYVPSFQFDERGHPRPAVARVIQLLGGTTSEWGLALWFASNNGWLGGNRPVDHLASAPEKVVEAAEREAEELVF